MSKLTEWLAVLSVFFGLYTAILTKQINHSLIDDNIFTIKILPLLLVILLGIYATVIILYRTLTFNECRKAAEELQYEIIEAKKDLSLKGMKF